MAASKRKTAAKKKAAKTAKPKAAAKKQAVKAPKPKVAKKAVKRKAAVKPMVSPAVADLDRRIAIVRNNLRDLAELATASSGASTEELTSGRIAEHEAQLQELTKQRDVLVGRKS